MRVFEKLFSKSVECFEFLLGFENFEKTALLLFLLQFFISVSSVLFVLSMKNDETIIIIIEDVQSRF